MGSGKASVSMRSKPEGSARSSRPAATLADLRLEGGDRLGRERAGHQPPDARVVGRVHGEQVRGGQVGAGVAGRVGRRPVAAHVRRRWAEPPVPQDGLGGGVVHRHPGAEAAADRVAAGAVPRTSGRGRPSILAASTGQGGHRATGTSGSPLAPPPGASRTFRRSSDTSRFSHTDASRKPGYWPCARPPDGPGRRLSWGSPPAPAGRHETRGVAHVRGQAGQALPALRWQLRRGVHARRRPVHPRLEREAPARVHLAGAAQPALAAPGALGRAALGRPLSAGGPPFICGKRTGRLRRRITFVLHFRLGLFAPSRTIKAVRLPS